MFNKRYRVKNIGNKNPRKSSLFFCARNEKFFPWIFFLIFWSQQHLVTPPCQHANISIWPTPPIHLFGDVILEWSLGHYKKNHIEIGILKSHQFGGRGVEKYAINVAHTKTLTRYFVMAGQ